MIHIDMIRQDTNHRAKRRRHQGRATCEVTGRRFEAQGPAPIYKLVTLLWLHGHDGEHLVVHQFEIRRRSQPYRIPRPIPICLAESMEGEKWQNIGFEHTCNLKNRGATTCAISWTLWLTPPAMLSCRTPRPGNSLKRI